MASCQSKKKGAAARQRPPQLCPQYFGSEGFCGPEGFCGSEGFCGPEGFCGFFGLSSDDMFNHLW